MNPRQLNGLALLALAAGAAWWWWRNRAATPPAETALALDELAQSNAGLRQIGSNFNADSSAEVVKAALAYSAELVRESGPCWRQVTGCDTHSNVIWRLGGDSSTDHVTKCGQIPFTHRVC